LTDSNVVLIGPPGSGKTSVGQLLAERSKRRFLDTDRVLEERHGVSVSEIFASYGEAHFRKLETDILLEIAGNNWTDVVLGTGGGVIVTPGNFQILEKLGLVICLFAPPSCLLERLKTDSSRPLLASGDESSKEKRIQELVAARESKYRMARYTIETANLAPEDVAVAIEKLLGMSDNTPKETATGIEYSDR
jgi:shikimate kinase